MAPAGSAANLYRGLSALPSFNPDDDPDPKQSMTIRDGLLAGDDTGFQYDGDRKEVPRIAVPCTSGQLSRSTIQQPDELPPEHLESVTIFGVFLRDGGRYENVVDTFHTPVSPFLNRR